MNVDASHAVDAKIVLADFYIGLNRNDAAVAVLEPLSKEADGFTPAMLRLASLDFANNNRPHAYEQVEQILKKSPHDDLLLNVTRSGGALRKGDWKLILGGNVKDDPDGKVKAKKKGEPSIELFHLVNDPSELFNLLIQSSCHLFRPSFPRRIGCFSPSPANAAMAC